MANPKLIRFCASKATPGDAIKLVSAISLPNGDPRTESAVFVGLSEKGHPIYRQTGCLYECSDKLGTTCNSSWMLMLIDNSPPQLTRYNQLNFPRNGWFRWKAGSGLTQEELFQALRIDSRGVWIVGAGGEPIHRTFQELCNNAEQIIGGSATEVVCKPAGIEE